MNPVKVIERGLADMAKYAYDNNIHKDDYVKMMDESVTNQMAKANKDTIDVVKNILAKSIAESQSRRDLHDAANAILMRARPSGSSMRMTATEIRTRKIKEAQERHGEFSEDGLDYFFESLIDLMDKAAKATDKKD